MTATRGLVAFEGHEVSPERLGDGGPAQRQPRHIGLRKAEQKLRLWRSYTLAWSLDSSE